MNRRQLLKFVGLGATAAVIPAAAVAAAPVPAAPILLPPPSSWRIHLRQAVANFYECGVREPVRKLGPVSLSMEFEDFVVCNVPDLRYLTDDHPSIFKRWQDPFDGSLLLPLSALRHAPVPDPLKSTITQFCPENPGGDFNKLAELGEFVVATWYVIGCANRPGTEQMKRLARDPHLGMSIIVAYLKESTQREDLICCETMP